MANKISWIKVNADSDFSIYNIPFGIYTDANVKHHACSAIGDQIIDLHELCRHGYLGNFSFDNLLFDESTLNDFIALGKEITNAVRHRIIELFTEGNTELQSNEAHRKDILKTQSSVKMLMPIRVGDYTDFYSSIDHATNIGKMIRDPENALMPNWKHIPVGYHGRASSVCVSGHSFHRPKIQFLR